jgi:ribosomal protein L37AE/L43A
MNRRTRLTKSDDLTPQAYRCPACCITAQMLIVWPSWVCQVCKAKLVPADLHPRSSEVNIGRHMQHEAEIFIEIDHSDLDSSDSDARHPEQETSG